MPTSRCSADQDDMRVFVDALRNWLGLAPLYAVERESVYGEETTALFCGTPREGRQSASNARHEVRSVAVEERQREQLQASVAPLPQRARWDFTKSEHRKREAAE